MFYVIDDSGILQWEVNAKHAIPAEFGFTEVPPPAGMIRPKFDGQKWVCLGNIPYEPTPEQQATEERYWRNAELVKADVEINKLDDRGQDSASWRAYRVALRNWPENENFPNKDWRPVAPGGES